MNCQEEFARTRLLLGDDGLQRLQGASVLLFGVGGVGGAVAEALARAGVGRITLVDGDVVSPSNVNRQIIALHSTLGQPKVEVMKARIRDIFPDCRVDAVQAFYNEETAGSFDLAAYSFVVDAIDDVPAKVDLAVRCHEGKIPFISAMGAGNKLDPTRFRVADLAKTEGCPLARILRRKLKERGVLHETVVYSPEPPVKTGQSAPGSLSFVPPVMGYVMAGHVIRKIAGI